MEQIRQRLAAKGHLDSRMELELAALWKYGVNRIVDPDLRATIEAFLGIVPLNFWFGAASKTKRLHPPWQHGRCGTLRSIIESCVLLPGMARHVPEILDANRDPDPRVVDIAYAATLVSDVWKKEEEGDVHHGPLHGTVAAEHWRDFAAGKLDPARIEEVAHGSVWHMGVYAPDWTPAAVFTPVTKLVNVCDVITSLPQLKHIYEGHATVE